MVLQLVLAALITIIVGFILFFALSRVKMGWLHRILNFNFKSENIFFLITLLIGITSMFLFKTNVQIWDVFISSLILSYKDKIMINCNIVYKKFKN